VLSHARAVLTAWKHDTITAGRTPLMAACRLSSSPRKLVWGMLHTGLNNPPAKGNILKPEPHYDWSEVGFQVKGIRSG